MSFDIYGNRKEDNRVKIHNIVGGRETSRDFLRCPTCISHPRLTIKEIDGIKKNWCHECGNTFNMEEKRNEETGGKHYVAKYPVVTKSIMISKKDNKKKKVSELSEEDKSDLAGLSSGAGAKLIDETTTYTDQGGRY